jgi:hypothetical protein
LQPGTSGYGSAATSLLEGTSAAGYALTADVNDPNVPVGAMYETSDSSGGFNLTGGYTCTVGQPVYLYSYGTSASTVTTKDTTTYTTTTTTTPTPETETITGITVAGSNNAGNTGTATYTITLGAALPLTAGQSVVIAGLTGNLSILNGTQAALAATTGTNTTFKVTATAVYGNYTYSYYTHRSGNSGHYTYSGQVTGTYYETVGNGTYYTVDTGYPTFHTSPAGDDGGGDDNGPNPDYEFTVTGGTAGSPSTGTGRFGTAGTATATELVTTTTTTPVITSAPTTQPELELATLGVCPASGNFSTPGSGNGALSFVYMNEVSTVATAYTFQPFTVASNNNAWDIGSSGTTQALVGIANAANTAAQLYDIEGASLTSTTNDGEGHLANFETQSTTGGVTTPNAGNGVVPQATIDTLANILAACIDSTPATGGVLSSQCTTLFNTATDNGQTFASGDTAPTDTATAAINIARYPAGNNSGTADPNYASDLFGIPTGTVPYAPNLAGAPNDWTIAINYPTSITAYPGVSNPDFGSAESIAVDDAGQIWVTAQVNKDIVRLAPLGVENAKNYFTYIPGYVSVDASNNAWTGNANDTTATSGNGDTGTGIFEAGSNGVFTETLPPTGGGYQRAYVVITDASNDVYFFASNNGVSQGATYNTYGTTAAPYSQMWEYNSAGVLQSSSPKCDGHTAAFVYNCISQPTADGTSIFNTGDFVGHGAIESAAKGGHLWLTSENSPYQIARVSPAGVADWVISTSTEQPEFPAIDASGNGWIANQAIPAQIYKITSAGVSTTLTSASTGATLNSTFGAAVDGNGNVWFANRCGNYGDCTNPSGANSIIEINGSTNTAISPSTNYVPEAQYPATATSFTTILDDSLNVAIDPSGNVWITNYIGGKVVELVGAAAPVVTPLSVAAGSNKFGQKP